MKRSQISCCLRIPGGRILSDFTGDAYRLIFELPFNSLGEYEQTLSGNINQDAWQDWYKKFKPHVQKKLPGNIKASNLIFLPELFIESAIFNT
jgi:hypothetical protein